jgi:mannose-6-phosphate isomerase-like protein (cupin superfamily)
MSDNLKRLRELTPTLKDFSKKPDPITTVVETEGGTCILHGLDTLPGEAKISLCEISAGSVVRCHQHPVNEYAIIIQGMLTIAFTDKIVTLAPGGCIHIPPYTEHTVTLVQGNVRALLITIPPSPEYPDGKTIQAKEI